MKAMSASLLARAWPLLFVTAAQQRCLFIAVSGDNIHRATGASRQRDECLASLLARAWPLLFVSAAQQRCLFIAVYTF